MNDTDESTAVFDIRRKFSEFVSGVSGSSVVSKLSFEGGNEESFSKQVDVIAARGQLSDLQLKLESTETRRKRARIEHERDMETIRQDRQRDQDKMSELNQQLIKMAKREETARNELAEQKKSAKAFAANSAEKLKAAQKEKLELMAALDKLRQSSHEKESEFKKVNLQLQQSLQSCQNELKETEQLLELARRDDTECQRLQLELSDVQTELANSRQEVKELELAMSRADENMKVGSALKSQLSRLSQLESDNKKLTEDNLYLRAVQQNTLLLNEECESLRQKLSRAEERSVKLATVEVECEDLKRRLSEWEAVECCGLAGGLRSPAQLTQTMADLQRTNELLLEKNGGLEASVHSLSAASDISKQQVQKLHSDLAAVTEKHRQAAETVRRLSRKFLLVSKERDGYKSIIDSYESEVTMSVSGQSDAKLRQNLEEVIGALRKHNASLEADVEKVSSEAVEYKTRIVLLEQQLNEDRESRPSSSSSSASNATQSVDDSIAVQLRQRIAELEQRLEKVTEENEHLSEQLERRDIQGDYDPRRTKVLQYSMNPFSTVHRKLTAELDQLREENRRLAKRLQIMEESRGLAVGDLSARVDNELHASSGKEVEEIKAQLQSAELRNKRLIEQFKKTSQELREVTYQLLGFRIDIPNTGQYRLMNVYAESASDYFLFKQSTGGELQMLANKYSEIFGDQIETYLRGADSIPAFLSSVTLELFQRQTIMQGRTL